MPSKKTITAAVIGDNLKPFASEYRKLGELFATGQGAAMQACALFAKHTVDETGLTADQVTAWYCETAKLAPGAMANFKSRIAAFGHANVAPHYEEIVAACDAAFATVKKGIRKHSGVDRLDSIKRIAAKLGKGEKIPLDTKSILKAVKSQPSTKSSKTPKAVPIKDSLTALLASVAPEPTPAQTKAFNALLKAYGV